VKALERYPDLKQTPTPLVYELALSPRKRETMSELSPSFTKDFSDERKAATNVRQSGLSETLASGRLGQSRQLQDALSVTQNLGAPVSGLHLQMTDSNDLKSARTSYLVGEVYSACR